MFHCPYLLHKFYLFDREHHLFELPTVLLEYLNLLQGVCSPPVATPIWLWLWNIQYSAQPYYCWWNHPNKDPTYVFIVWKEDALLPAMFNPLCSSINQQIFKRTFVIKVATMKIMDDLMEAITCVPLNWHFLWWTKMNGTQRRAVLSPWRTHCMHSGMAKGTSRAEATLNSEKIKTVASAIVELCESEGIRQAGS